MMEFRKLNDADYLSKRDALLEKVEGAVAHPYADSEGIPTIGIGLNMRVMKNLGQIVKDLSPHMEGDSIKQLQAVAAKHYPPGAKVNNPVMQAVNAQMAAFHKQDSTIPERLQYPDKETMRHTLDVVAEKTYERQVDAWLPGIPRSEERAALVSLAYNGLVGVKKGKEGEQDTYKSASLRHAILSGDRAEAWVQIDALSNGGASHGTGIAKRRALEADTFHVAADPANPSLAESRQIETMRFRHAEALEKNATRYPDVQARVKRDYGADITPLSTTRDAGHALEATWKKLEESLPHPVKDEALLKVLAGRDYREVAYDLDACFSKTPSSAAMDGGQLYAVSPQLLASAKPTGRER